MVDSTILPNLPASPLLRAGSPQSTKTMIVQKEDEVDERSKRAADALEFAIRFPDLPPTNPPFYAVGKQEEKTQPLSLRERREAAEKELVTIKRQEQVTDRISALRKRKRDIGDQMEVLCKETTWIDSRIATLEEDLSEAPPTKPVCYSSSNAKETAPPGWVSFCDGRRCNKPHIHRQRFVCHYGRNCHRQTCCFFHPPAPRSGK